MSPSVIFQAFCPGWRSGNNPGQLITYWSLTARRLWCHPDGNFRAQSSAGASLAAQAPSFTRFTRKLDCAIKPVRLYCAQSVWKFESPVFVILERTPAQSIASGAPGEIRTPGLLVRSQALYPTELRAHFASVSISRSTARSAPAHSLVTPRQMRSADLFKSLICQFFPTGSNHWLTPLWPGALSKLKDLAAPSAQCGGEGAIARCCAPRPCAALRDRRR